MGYQEFIYSIRVYSTKGSERNGVYGSVSSFFFFQVGSIEDEDHMSKGKKVFSSKMRNKQPSIDTIMAKLVFTFLSCNGG